MLCAYNRSEREMTIAQEFIQIVLSLSLSLALYLNIIFIYFGLHARSISRCRTVTVASLYRDRIPFQTWPSPHFSSLSEYRCSSSSSSSSSFSCSIFLICCNLFSFVAVSVLASYQFLSIRLARFAISGHFVVMIFREIPTVLRVTLLKRRFAKYSYTDIPGLNPDTRN